MIVGDANVGKTSLVGKFLDGNKTEKPTPTLGVEYRTKVIQVVLDGEFYNAKVKIWDTAG